MRWQVKHRMDFITRTLATRGRLNRHDLIQEYAISQIQASLDIKHYLALYPGSMAYDIHRKTYVAVGPCDASGTS